MDIASDVVELFLTKDQPRATELAEKLNRLNDERRATEAKALESIETQLATSIGTSADLLAECIILDDPNWHRGVLGILASRVVDRTGRPALVVTHQDGHAHGSGRSIEGFHLLDALTAVHGEIHTPDALFTRFGGHAHAVGFSMPSDRMDLLRERMQLYGSTRLTETILTPPLKCDTEALLSDLTPDFFDWLKRCEPFGIGNREPVFVTRGLTLTAPVRFIKEKHVCLQLEKAGETLRFSALGWSRSFDWPARCTEIALDKGSLIDVAYRLKTKSNPQFPGLELELVDIRIA
jgi:single-stranded-DNA-specific exonuclease